MNHLRNIVPKPVLLCLAAGLSLLGGAATLRAVAQPPAPKPTQTARAASKPAPPASKGKRRVAFIGKQMSYTERTRIHDLRGNVRFTSEDTVLTTDYATFSETTNIASSPGPLKIVDALNTVTGNTGTAFYNSKDVKLRGNVVIVARPRDGDRAAPEGSPRRQFDAPATITCETVDYNWGTRVAFLTGGLKVVQKDRTVTADKATYEARLERVTLEGNVFYTNTKGDKFRFTKAVINMKEGEEDFQGENAQGDVETEVELEDEPAAKPTVPGAPTPNPGTPPAPAPGTAPKPTPTIPDPTKPEPGKEDPKPPADPAPPTPTPPTDPKGKP